MAVKMLPYEISQALCMGSLTGRYVHDDDDGKRNVSAM